MPASNRSARSRKMSDNLDWTQDLGDAFLSQKTQLMDTVLPY